MWNKFNLKIQLIIFMTLVITVVEFSTLFIISNIQKTSTQENALQDVKNIVKSLNNDFVKVLLNVNTDSLSDITFRLSAFKKINGIILYDSHNKPIYRYKNIENIKIYKKQVLNDKYIFLERRIFTKQNIEVDNYEFGYIIIDVDKSGYVQQYTSMMKQIAQVFPLTLLLGILLSLFISKSYTKPFTKMLNAMRESDPTKNNIVVLKTTAQNEIKELFTEFNTQMEQINISTKKINNLSKEIEDTQKEVVFTMGAIAESRSKETGNHVKRVAQYSKILALHYGLDEKKAEMLKQASPMHDIGKVAIPDAVLNKPGRFDENERKIMDTHAQLGYDMLKMSNRPLLKTAATVAYEHHEKWNGKGYPNQLKGENIHIYGRITAIADVFDALGSARVYKEAWDDERIFKMFKEERGEHFDPKLIDIFFDHLDEFLEVRKQFRDI
ncbi:MAG: HD domain-containing protein [Campylobacterota bacterium]|nr:HD domain-containing protein [Campylobacterota bacterium]